VLVVGAKRSREAGPIMGRLFRECDMERGAYDQKHAGAQRSTEVHRRIHERGSAAFASTPEKHGLICQFSISCPVPTPHAPIAWSYHLGAWDGVGTARTTQSGRYLWPREIISRRLHDRAPVGALPPSPEQRDKAAPLGKGVKPPRRAGYCRELEATGALPAGETNPPSRIPASAIWWLV
jgi:hypothetical protein